MRVAGMTAYARICGATLARAHARSGDRIAIASYLGKSDAFDRAIADFSSAYADQNERDYLAITQAVKSGRLTSSRRPGSRRVAESLGSNPSVRKRGTDGRHHRGAARRHRGPVRADGERVQRRATATASRSSGLSPRRCTSPTGRSARSATSPRQLRRTLGRRGQQLRRATRRTRFCPSWSQATTAGGRGRGDPRTPTSKATRSPTTSICSRAPCRRRSVDCSLFIDPFGRPLSPVSAAGMHRRASAAPDLTTRGPVSASASRSSSGRTGTDTDGLHRFLARAESCRSTAPGCWNSRSEPRRCWSPWRCSRTRRRSRDDQARDRGDPHAAAGSLSSWRSRSPRSTSCPGAG